MSQPQCPQCGTELSEEFGMVTCSGCGSVVFIDFEGQAQLASSEPTVPSPDHSERTSDHSESAAGQSEPLEFEITPGDGDQIFNGADDGHSPGPSQAETPEGPLDISAYANSEASQAKEGPLTYTVHIEGLDSKELRESLREALGEGRFNWDPRALMATIREGQLTLKSVEPVKASVLVNRLKRLPLKIWWEQNVITESNP